VGKAQPESKTPAEVPDGDHGLRWTSRIATVTNWELGAGDLAMPRAAKDRVRRPGGPPAAQETAAHG
jgi:hypothetical protein